MSSSRALSLLGWCLAALVLVGAGAEAVSLWQVEQAHPAPPRWDMAGHGWQGVELLTDLEAGRPLDFLVHLNAQDKWPFGYSLLLLPCLAIGGATFTSARMLSLVGWVAVAPLTVLAARRVDPGPAGLLAGALAAVLWLTAPVERVLALVILRETVSLALLLLALILYLRAREREGPTEREQPAGSGGALGAWRAAGLATLALVLVKYTYALIWIVAVALDELRRMPRDRRRRVVRWLSVLLTPWGEKPLRRRLLAGALDLLLLAALIGVNPGIPIWLGLVVTAVALGVQARRGRFSLRDRLAAFPARYRAAVETVALPVAVWWLSPHPIHPKTVYAFFRNSGGGSERAPLDVFFYLRSYLADYVPHPAWGLALLGLALVAGLLALRREGPLRVLALLALAGLVLVSIHPHKEVRYGATALPLVTLMGALGLGRLIFGRGIAARGGGLGRLIAGSLLGLGIVAAGVVTGLSGETRERLDHRLAGEYMLYTGDPRVLPLLEPLAERVGPKGRVGVVGAVDELSADLVRWALAREHGASAPRVGELRKRFDPRAPREEWWPRVERWLKTEGLDRVLVLRLDPDSPWARRDDYRMHNAWQAAAAEALVEIYPPRREPVRAPEIGLRADVLEIDRSRGPEHEQGEAR